MAIVRSKEVFIYGLNSDRKAILEEFQKRGTLEVRDVDVSGDGLHRTETAKRISQFDGYIKTASDALEILDEYAPVKTGLFSEREPLPMSEYSMKTKESEDALKAALDIVHLSDKIHENAENMRRIDAKQIALRPYMKLDVPMNITETKKTDIRSGLLPGEWDKALIDKFVRKHDLKDFYWEFIDNEKDESSIWMMYPKTDSKAVQAFLQDIGLQEPSFSLSHHVPRKKIEVLENARIDLGAKNEDLKNKIKAHAKDRKRIELLYDHLLMRKEKYQALSKMGMTDHTFVLEGYILDNHAEKTKQYIEKNYNAYVELKTPENLNDAPEAFVNNVFVAPVEGITETYSMPSTTDIDPNPIMSVFYYIFFGMMFSDAGYGIMLLIATAILGFGKVVEKSKRAMFRMFFFCGISTTFWGFMFGSFFGDAIKAFSGGQYNLPPIWLDPQTEPLTLLIFAVAIGLINILVGLGIRFYEDWKIKNYTGAIFDTLTWMVILAGVGVLAIGASTGNDIVKNIGIWMIIGGAVLLVCTHGRDKKNPIMKVFGGILGLYDVTSYVGDILSYSRLMALGLTTGVIASVINLLGPVFGELVFGDSPLAIIIVVIIFVLGHIVNFALNMLGAYVHTNRLQYVEFFSKFYDGGGRKFVPLKMDTKYYRFTEENQN